MRKLLPIVISTLALGLAACAPSGGPAETPEEPAVTTEPAADTPAAAPDEAGVRMIPISTPKGDFKV